MATVKRHELKLNVTVVSTGCTPWYGMLERRILMLERPKAWRTVAK